MSIFELIEFFNISTPVRISSMRGSCSNMDNTSSLNETCWSCVPSASLASILQKNSSVICVVGLGQTDVAVANMIKSCIQTNY
jgi:hypothetical protein